MRRKDPIRIGDALSEFFRSSPTIARKIAEARISDLWPQLVGDIIASYTTKLEVKAGRLHINISSSVARSEVFMRREALKNAINHASGMEVITTIIVK